MAYVRHRKLLRLVFEGDLDGLEVHVRPGSVLLYEEIAELASEPFASPPTRENLAALRALYERFAGVLVSWNLEEVADDVPGAVSVAVPATLEGLLTQDPSFVNTVVTAWLDAAALTERDQRAAAAAAAGMESSLAMEPLNVS